MEWNAYHFVGETLRDGSPIPPDGVTLRHNGEITLCERGLHFSRKAWQALKYAPGVTLCRVHVAGEVIEPKGEDKGVCTERTIIARIDATDLLFGFARACALDVIRLWNAPDVVRKYLETGDESIKAAAKAAAWAGWDARAAAGAARAAANDARAAWDAAKAARDAARDAARAAARAASDASDARATAWDAANRKQSARFTSMVNNAFKEAGQ